MSNDRKTTGFFRTNRRAFLRAGGVCLGLPLLEAFEPRRAHGQAAARPTYAAFFLTCNGVAQARTAVFLDGRPAEPEMWWPRQTGPLTTEALQADLNLPEDASSGDRVRALGELAAWADRLIIVKGVRHGFPSLDCAHSGASNQVLTGHSLARGGFNTVPEGESLDYRIARERNPEGRGPLQLHFRRPDEAREASRTMFYSAPRTPEFGDGDPLVVYNRIIGLSGNVAPDDVQRLATDRRSVNDLLRVEMQELLARSDLSSFDRTNLQNHFEAIRDIEIKLGSVFAPERVELMKRLSEGELFQLDESREDVVDLHMDLMAFALSSGYTTIASLLVFGSTTAYDVGGDSRNYGFHRISHRIDGNGASGPPIANANILHHRVDRFYARQYMTLLDKLHRYDTPFGKILDEGFAVWANQLGTGGHSYRDIPWVITGSAQGFLKTGQYVNLPNGGVTGNRMLNTLLNAAGLRKSTGELIDDFGAPSLSKGVIREIMA